MLLLRVRDIILTNVRHALLLLLGTPSNTFGDTFQKQVDLLLGTPSKNRLICLKKEA